MPRCLPAATKWKKRGRSWMRSKPRGASLQTSHSIPPGRGVPTKRTIFWLATDGPGADFNVMPVTAPSYSLGTPVEINRIQKELKKIWDTGDGGMTRASLMNLAVYSEEPGSLEKNTDLIAQLTEDHACRAIVIGADPSAKENRVEAWISAHCHMRSGNKQVCSEHLSFLLEGPCTSLLPNIVFSHLDSDLPFCLWWQGNLHDPMD